VNHRRITLTLGAAGGGLLAAAFFHTAVAFADPEFYPIGPEAPEITWKFLPNLEISTGTQEFGVGDPTVGTVDAEVINSDFFGVTISGYVITADLTGGMGDPIIGSTYDTTVFGDTGYENVFTDIATVGGTVSIIDTFDTPYGDFTIPLLVFDGATSAATASTDGLGTSAADSLAGIAASLGSLF
jgi:hypothetical protein